MKNKEKLAEEFVKKRLEKETGLKFSKQKLHVGKKRDGTPKYHEFDLVSEDESIVVEIKSGKGIVGKGNTNNAGISTCFEDCYLLSKIPVEKKILVLTDKNMYELFKRKSDGIVNKDGVVVRYFDMRKAKK